MKTDDLIRLLAADAVPVPRRAATWRIALGLLAGSCISLVLLYGLFGLRPDMREAAQWPMFWIKLLLPAALAAASFVMLQRLARPGVTVGARWVAFALPVLAIWVLAAASLLAAPDGTRAALLLGQSWRSCTASILLIALPPFAAAFVALSTLAPTRRAWAGGCAGAMAGAIGAGVYALHCIEMAAPFVGAWYLLGIALAAGAGALLGPRLLRW